MEPGINDEKADMHQSLEDDGASYRSYHSDEEKPLISRRQRYEARTSLGPVHLKLGSGSH